MAVKHFSGIKWQVYCILGLMLQLCACSKKNTGNTQPAFASLPVEQPLSSLIAEASGIADSKLNPGYLWVEQDSGNPPELYLLSHTARFLKSIYIKGAADRDWEDIALGAGPDPAKQYLYIAEIGDNNAVYASAGFYRFEEPAAATDTVRNIDFIPFVYPDGPRDAEAFLIDNNNRDIYVITKREAKSRLYKLAYPYSIATLNNAVFIQELPYSGVVSAAQSNDGQGIIIKTYSELHYYNRAAGETIAQTLQKSFTLLDYQLEPQGEAVAFALDNTGFYTLSEKGLSTKQSLYFYKKN